MSNVQGCAVVKGARVALMLVVGIVLGRGGALADSFGLSVNAVASAVITAAGQSDVQQLNTGLLQVKSITVNPITASVSASFPGSGSASASAETEGEVRFGTITDFVSASGSESCQAPPGTECFGTNPTASFVGIWQDAITITSNTLPDGSPVDLVATVSVDGELHCTGVGASVQNLATFTVGPSPLVLSSNLCNSVFRESQSITVAAFVGEALAMQGQSSIFAGAQGLNGEPAVATVDPPASAFFIDSATPGASYVTASGHSYSSTPEPGTLTLFGSGLFGLGSVLRRRWSGLA